ncbi:MAG: tRNA pseudouridine(38-40) synthase TruA [Nitrospirae bacterium GWC2_46_6]|nr:MAG: tRNA pseudouridine(38-40) synthase TruA [Nitrospirae bacterium GWC2_46_6]OGW20744.1 MAG: tRNA pseudouridine(38-40) synthase TruA [Nitrospirae bacterium GWA2_46_11]OGW22700.1 MAG: tRNA pseudouridine(38-40) synthase TruA [Nitrospirae bacterium GWB2_47_37]HAK87923.1 tRNA pseudouridine(38-40) synthase TruA [Nitrospiraceae bacterium]HCL81423.1 tRNA pseudouridine(38-40) synthase TruA [Nitrospiraceae bacterium]
MRSIKLTIQYDGTDYNGWQIQPPDTSDYRKQKNIITIQGIIQDAIKKITGEDVKLIGAGRTDAGVHALAQVAAFRTDSKLQPDVIKRALNANLPDDVRITDSCDIDEDFHPRYGAKSKIYFYLISGSHMVSPFLYRYAWRMPHELDFEAAEEALRSFKGRHDFSSFRGSGCGAKNPVRTVMDASIEHLNAIDFMTARLGGDFIKIRIEADAFLRHMVRNIVGTIVEIGRGKIKPEDMEKILLSKNRKNAGPTAPARGLFLEKVIY